MFALVVPILCMVFQDEYTKVPEPTLVPSETSEPKAGWCTPPCGG